jgi:hypothetical protein
MFELVPLSINEISLVKKYGVSIVYNVAFSSADRSERGGKKLLGRRKVGAEASQLVT